MAIAPRARVAMRRLSAGARPPTPPDALGVTIAVYGGASAYAVVDERRWLVLDGDALTLDHVDPDAELATLWIEVLDDPRVAIDRCARPELAVTPRAGAIRQRRRARARRDLAGRACRVTGGRGRHLVRVAYITTGADGARRARYRDDRADRASSSRGSRSRRRAGTSAASCACSIARAVGAHAARARARKTCARRLDRRASRRRRARLVAHGAGSTPARCHRRASSRRRRAGTPSRRARYGSASSSRPPSCAAGELRVHVALPDERRETSTSTVAAERERGRPEASARAAVDRSRAVGRARARRGEPATAKCVDQLRRCRSRTSARRRAK